MTAKPFFALMLAIGAVLPAAAQTGDTTLTVTAERDGITARQRAVPAQLSASEQRAWRALFLDIEAGRLSKAEAALPGLPNPLLRETVRAEIIAARGTGRGQLSRAKLVDWLSANTDLPEATQIARIARRLRGTSGPMPTLPEPRALRYVSFTPPLSYASETSSEDRAADALKPLLSAERNAEAEAAWTAAADSLSSGARTEWAQRIAWSYYGQNDNRAAVRMGLEAARGMGPWAGLGAWTAGLAAWRLGDHDSAATAFDLIHSRLAGSPRTEDLAAAAAYWASRAHMAAGRPELVTPRLERAAQVAPHSLYGLLARRALGLAPVQDWAEPDFITADWNHLRNFAGARRAAALVEIGQIGLADRELKHLAATVSEANYPALLRLAARLSLPATQYSLAVRPPVGIEPPLSARFPAPDWEPARGWRIDRSLVFAHALQESNFVTTATSRVGAKGLMQLMPATARELQRQMSSEGTPIGDRDDPAFNIELGQTYLESLRDSVWTEGRLPKVIAAYNAGPGSVQTWNETLDDRNDPLLFMASIPFLETRHYVSVVMRNYWMYALREGGDVSSMNDMISGRWPLFPRNSFNAD